ncbi:hypothetical protein [Bacillus sp. FJAT-27445]|uniref:hypothetical protein n=1 Tax=Bacillus sp. FJAT-27445 TaxID=1679166 RepID=UPI000743BDAE|nr:hypothetical protein [Bacillus sp. FJAT-27445]
MKKVILSIIFLVSILSGCGVLEKPPQTASNVGMEKTKDVELVEVNQENEQDIELTSEEQKILKKTMNLSLILFKAMKEKDYNTIKLLLSPTAAVSLDEKGNKFIEDAPYGKSEINLYSGEINMENLKYSFHNFEENGNFTIGFMVFRGDSHFTAYMTFVKSNNGWLLHSYYTN